MSSLRKALAWQNRHFPLCPSSSGKRPTGWSSLRELCDTGSDTLATLLSWQAERVAGMDLRAQAAFLVANLSYRLSLMLGSVYLKETALPRLDADLLYLKLSQTPAAQSSTPAASHLHLHLADETGAAFPEQPEAMPAQLSAQLESCMDPLVERLRTDTRLAPAAQWRLIADSLAMGFLLVGQALDQEETAKQKALAVVKRPGSRLFNKQLGFISLSLPNPEGTPQRPRSFVSRGGCCRYYTVEGGQLCPTCVLEPLDKQHSRLRELHAPAAAEGS
ncbi:(2Fe-2S)-binding protein [Fodinicurvata halophila]|uniref:(2Fe-2S)-binding protein n=1 Tax=Fodinicurvata halophila TaxID=1419723 RepID=A0ABV8ULN2_9PROT